MKAYDKFYNRVGKRLIGFVLSVPLIIVMLPFYLLISLAIIIDEDMFVFDDEETDLAVPADGETGEIPLVPYDYDDITVGNLTPLK